MSKALEFCLLDIDYRDREGGSQILLYGRTREGQRVVVVDPTYVPYFYVLPADLQKARSEIEARLKKAKLPVRGIQEVPRIFFGEEQTFLRIDCYRSPDPSKVRDQIKGLERARGGSGSVMEEYEYQMGYSRSYLADRGWGGLDWLRVEGAPVTLPVEADQVLEARHLERVDRPPLALRVLAFDIEVVEERRGQRQVIMLSLYGEGFQRVLTYKTPTAGAYPDFVEVVPDEKALLRRFVDLVAEQDPDVLTGYNTDGYDFEVIRERAQALRVQLGRLSLDGSGITLSRRARASTARLKGRVHMDLFHFVSNILAPALQTEVLTLDAVAGELLGESKMAMTFPEIVAAWKEGRDLPRLATYCLKDSELTWRLAQVLLPQMAELTRIVGQSLFDTSRMMYSQLVEWYYTRRAKAEGRIIPNQPRFEEIRKRQQETYLGGYVLEPEAGLHEHIAVIDFASLYPSIISTYNISLDALNCTCCQEDAHRVPDLPHWFCRKRRGFEARVIEDLLEERRRLKAALARTRKGTREYHLLDTRQQAVKTIANAAYGYFGFPASKWYSKECAESVTAYGRYWIQQVLERARKAGFPPLYGDTDSAFLHLGKRPHKALLQFLEALNQDLPGIMRLDLEAFYRRGIFIPREMGGGTAKKRYALLDEAGGLKIRGLERVRRDWSNLAKRLQEEVLRRVLARVDVEGAVAQVRETIQRLRARDVSLEDLVVYEQITRPLKDYKVTAPHITAARRLEAQGIAVAPGSVIGYVIEAGEGAISQKAQPVEFAAVERIDVDYYIHHQILPAALRILRVLGVGEEALLA